MQHLLYGEKFDGLVFVGKYFNLLESIQAVQHMVSKQMC